MDAMTKENDSGLGQFDTPEAASAAVTEAGNRTLEALKGHLSPDKRSFNEGLLQNLNGGRAFLTKKGLLITAEVALALGFLTPALPK